jgi:hypothetical protein
VDVAREQRGDVRAGELAQADAERVDHRVERLVGDLLPLVAAPGEDHGPVLPAEAVEEAPHQDALPHAGAPVDMGDGGRPVPRGVERLAQRRELSFAPEEGASTVCSWERATGGDAVGFSPPRTARMSRVRGRAAGSRWRRRLVKSARSAGIPVASVAGEGASALCFSMRSFIPRLR